MLNFILGFYVEMDNRNFHDREACVDAKFRRRERDDLADELAGRENGRIKRLDHPGEAPPNSKKEQERKRRESAASMTQLQVLLNDLVYRALYNETFDQLRAAEAATEAALETAHDALSQADTALEDTLANAARLPGGTRVFRDADGNIRTEDGEIVSGPDAETIVWNGGEPSYEELLARRKASEETRQRVNDLLRYQNDVLGRARDRMEDPDNPPSPDELKQIQDDIEEGARQLGINDPGQELVDASAKPSSFDLPTGAPS